MLFLFVEFVFIAFGFSATYQKMNAFQILIHFTGCMHSFLMIVAEYSYTNVGPIFFLYCVIPFALEVVVGVLVCKNKFIMDSIREKKV